MALRADSYSSLAEVAALAPVAAESGFDATTTPTNEQVEKFVDRASGVLNMALRVHGFDPTDVRANSTATLMCDEWVTSKAVAMVEKAQPGAGMPPPDRNGDPIAMLYESAEEFVGKFALGLKRAGVAPDGATSDGLTYTGLDRHDERSDPDNAQREQPLFRRRQFENDRL